MIFNICLYLYLIILFMSQDSISTLESKFKDEKNTPLGVKEDHKFYGQCIGKIKNVESLQKYDIDDPNCELLLDQSEFYIQNASTSFQQKSLDLFFHKEFSTDHLRQSIVDYTQNGAENIKEYELTAKMNIQEFSKKYSVSQDYANGCCMALSYYTGAYSERVSRTCNIIIKLYVQNKAHNIKDTKEYDHMRCIGQWLFRALNCISLYWGKVTRCVNLDSEEYQTLYKPGNIVTWLQFSSSSYGKPTPYFATRNTRFIIYSISGRCIQNFSNYKGQATQTEVLFKPYSHFVVIKKKIQGPIKYIYMRELFIGQSAKNMLWVDDRIFDPNWENKMIMESVIKKDPLLNIIPKVSTQCAIAFLRSEIGVNRKKSAFRIMTDMNRLNESPSHNAGARFLKACQAMYLNYSCLIFTSDEKKAKQMLQQLSVSLKEVKITVISQEAMQFLQFE